ncbi:hypothetical protein [Methylococcus capsulatus]|uniref:Uncharacterized protein n=2 Tax=Methylococcus capsulatus TaxID=414 RepID=Q605U9_METCA|nr:hypothetical protein [Methylococcus capsulatus]AAU91593.1 hypothetical protein MCA2177 [Methylococcus capsulatus str. Bath]QXP87225.1 hypothetical protein KW112_12735 [Methylococcus capsulatus]QXP91426.1 hypothetical protein KW114_04550 [Methylococcus capsulatus]QXP93095.1 hypothetical protein KW113_12110 [Methylococcus capsulatus]UQN12220.1 hypothetical protein M3M30_14490 [Methylococcus capsulatus]
MNNHGLRRVLLASFLGLATGVSFAGGRYADPPPNLVEVFNASKAALEAAKQSNKDLCLENAKKARKLAIDSYKEKSTMPMQLSSSRLKSVINSLEAGQVTEAVAPLEEVVKEVGDEVEYYKKEGKL